MRFTLLIPPWLLLCLHIPYLKPPLSHNNMTLKPWESATQRFRPKKQQVLLWRTKGIGSNAKEMMVGSALTRSFWSKAIWFCDIMSPKCQGFYNHFMKEDLCLSYYLRYHSILYIYLFVFVFSMLTALLSLSIYIYIYNVVFMCVILYVFNAQMISEGLLRLPPGWRFCAWLMTPLQDNEIFESLREASLQKTCHEQVAGHESDLWWGQVVRNR